MRDLIRGPWFQTADSDWSIDTPGSNTCTFIHDENDDPVAIVAVNSAFDKDDELDAKASLITSAPELLDALVQLQTHVIQHAVTWDEAKNGSHHHPIWSKVASAIAKAKGGAA